MPKANEGAHVAYTTGQGPTDFGDPVAVQIFGTQVKALLYAVANGHKYVFWPYGTTLADAIEAEKARTKP